MGEVQGEWEVVAVHAGKVVGDVNQEVVEEGNWEVVDVIGKLGDMEVFALYPGKVVGDVNREVVEEVNWEVVDVIGEVGDVEVFALYPGKVVEDLKREHCDLSPRDLPVVAVVSVNRQHWNLRDLMEVKPELQREHAFVERDRRLASLAPEGEMIQDLKELRKVRKVQKVVPVEDVEVNRQHWSLASLAPEGEMIQDLKELRKVRKVVPGPTRQRC